MNSHMSTIGDGTYFETKSWFPWGAAAAVLGQQSSSSRGTRAAKQRRTTIAAACQRCLSFVAFHAWCIYLFTFSDMKTILFPQSLFGILTALSEVQQQQSSSSPAFSSERHESDLSSTRFAILGRMPLVLFWVYINLLPFDIYNQASDDEAIAEDAVNKPWRVLPSKYWSVGQARRAVVFFYCAAVSTSWALGLGMRSTIALIGFGMWYNSFRGADCHALVRNLINALGYTSFACGALEVALGRNLHFDLPGLPAYSTFIVDAQQSTQALLASSPFLSPLLASLGTGGGAPNAPLVQEAAGTATVTDAAPPSLEKWLLVIAAIILTTVHTQDMEDQEGDSARGRKSLPLQIGDGPARWVTAVCMGVWSVFCPWFWASTVSGGGMLGGVVEYLLTTPLALGVAWRTLTKRGVRDDKRTFKLWNLWIVSLYLLPMVSRSFAG